MAVANNSKEIIELLISKGINMNVKDKVYRKIKIQFLTKIISIKLRYLNNNFNTPLHYTANCKSKEIGELLLSEGADFNAINIFYSIL